MSGINFISIYRKIEINFISIPHQIPLYSPFFLNPLFSSRSHFRLIWSINRIIKSSLLWRKGNPNKKPLYLSLLQQQIKRFLLRSINKPIFLFTLQSIGKKNFTGTSKVGCKIYNRRLRVTRNLLIDCTWGRILFFFLHKNKLSSACACSKQRKKKNG